MAEDLKMSERRSTLAATTPKVALATSISILKGCGSLAILFLFLLAAMTNAHATATTTTTALTAALTSAPATTVTTASYGASVTLTATVTGTGAAGHVAFTYGATAATATTALAACTTQTVSSGTATCVTAALPLGNSFLKAAFTPTSTTAFTASSATSASAFSVTKATPTVSLTAALTSALGTTITTAPFGASVTLTASGLPASSGTVIFENNGTQLGSTAATVSSSGTATLATATLPVGTSNSLTAVFTPSVAAATDYNTNTSSALVFDVTTATTVTLATSASSLVYGNSVTLTAGGLPALATGTVNFMNGSTQVGTCTVASGTCNIAPTLAVGSYSLTAVYLGSSTYAASTSSAKSVSVTQATPTVTLTAAPGPYYYGSSVTLTAAVTPAGTVTFYNGGTALCSNVTVSSGTASCVTAALPLGTDSQLKATFTPTLTADYATANSNLVSVTINAYPTAVALQSSVSTITPGTSFTLTATVTTTAGSANVIAGNVTFYDSSKELGKVAVNSSGIATFATPTTLALGKHYFIASYGGVYNSGTVEFSTSLSSSAQVTIDSSQTINAFTPPTTPVTYGASAVLPAVTSTSGLPVTFTASGACSVSGNTLSYSSVGTCTVTAVQAGNSAYAAATPVINTVTVNPAPLVITASSPSAMPYGTAVPTITASYSGFIGTDTKWTLTTRPTCSTTYTTTSAPASYPTSCSGAVDPNYSISYVSGSVSVTIASQTISHWYSSSTVYGTPVALSAISSSGLTVSYSMISGPGTISGTTLTPTGIGTIVVAANQAGNSNYTAATQATKTVAVYPAPLVITASSPSSITYGTAVPTITPNYSAFANGDSSASLSASPTCFTAYTATSAPGSYVAICYGAADPNYDISYTSGSVTVNKATPTVSSWPTASTITYGSALSASTLTGGASNGTFAWANSATIPGAGTPSENVIFTPTNSTDYTTATGPVSVTVNKATPTVSIPPTAASIAYGSALSASRLSGGTASTPGAFSWTSSSTVPASMGANSEGVTFTPTDLTDYTTTTSTASVTVNKATPTVTWPTASSITYGQALSNSNLSGGASSMGGTFAWTEPTAVPSAGTPSESVIFTPSNTAEYTTATHAVSVTVNQAPASVSSWPTASPITYGQALSSSNLTGGSTAGRFAWTDPTTIPGAGTNSYSVTFTPTNSTDYGTTTNNVSVTVNQVAPLVSAWPTAAPITSGQALNSSTLTGGAANTDGTFNWTSTSTVPGVGTTSYNVTFTPSDATDYSTANGWVSVTVNPCGLQDSLNSVYSTALNVYVGGETASDLTLDAEGNNESAICAVNSNPTDVTTVIYPFITSNAGSTYPADSSSNGTNAAVLAYGTVATANTGATITITDDGAGDPGFISTANNYSNGVFASMGGTVNITDTVISTSGNGSHGLDATYAGTLNITNVTAFTSGTDSSVIVAGVGGGKVTSTFGTYTSGGLRSAGIRAAGTGSSVSLSGDSITAQNGAAVVVEGGNSVVIGSSASLSGALGDDHGIFLYEGNSGDATAGTSIFTMTNGSITYTCDATTSSVNPCPTGLASNNQNSPATLFSVANTTATITLTDVTVTNTTPTNTNNNGTLLTAAALNSGTSGSNGGNVTFNANGETLAGDVIVDSISTVNLNLAADSAPSPVPSTLLGTINGANSGGTVNLTLDAISTWVVTGNSNLTTLNNAVIGNGNITCYYTGQCSVYVGGQLLSGVN
jgi:Big-like domain-containing protein/MBG domain-containing protein